MKTRTRRCAVLKLLDQCVASEHRLLRARANIYELNHLVVQCATRDDRQTTAAALLHHLHLRVDDRDDYDRTPGIRLTQLLRDQSSARGTWSGSEGNELLNRLGGPRLTSTVNVPPLRSAELWSGAPPS